MDTRQKSHIVFFEEGDTDKIFFDALIHFYREHSESAVSSCEIINGNKIYLKGRSVSQFIPLIDIGKIRSKRIAALKEFETIINFKTNKISEL